MRALQFFEFGDPSKLQLVNVPDPICSEETAIVRIKAASVNPSDVKNVAGQMEHTVLPRVPGRDFSGVVEQGPAGWKGVEVWGTGGSVGFSEDGSHAELIAFPVKALVGKPRNLEHAVASAIGVNFVIAWLGLMMHAQLQPGETVAVIGAGGGVGGAVVQIAKNQGCRVIAVDRRPLAADSPAGRLVDDYVPANQDAPMEIKRLTRGLGAAVVFDTVGGIMFEPSLLSLAQRGRLVEISATGRRRVEFDAIDFYHNEWRIFGADSRKLDAVASAAILANLVAGFESGAYIPPLIAEQFPLQEGRLAYEAVARGTAGRVVLLP